MTERGVIEPGVQVQGLLDELEAARAEFAAALAEVDRELVTVPGVVDGWSVRDLVVHVAFWAEHGAAAIELAQSGRGDEFAYSTADTDAMNARLLAESSSISPAAAVEREAVAYDRLRDAIAALDSSLLDLRLANGDTPAAVARYDGAEHYLEHTAHLRAWFGDGDADD